MKTRVPATPPGSVVVAGGGIAGMSAALRLAERGYHVTIYEKDDELGGDLRSRRMLGGLDAQYNDVYPHMFGTWYENFWRLFEDAGGRPREEAFVSVSEMYQLRRLQYPHFDEVTDPYSPAHFLRNVFSGLQPPVDIYLSMYAAMDLLAERLQPTTLLDQLSTNGFFRSRPYMTERAAEIHDAFTTLVWGLPSYLTSAAAYQRFLSYGFKNPVPMFWLLSGPAQELLVKPIHARLAALGVVVIDNADVTGVSQTDGHVTGIRVKRSGRSSWVPVDDLVLAVPPDAASRLVRTGELGHRIVDAAPSLAELSQLRTIALPVVSLWLKKHLPEIPGQPVSLLGSRYGLAFTNVAPAWARSDPHMATRTVLSLSCSDPFALPSRSRQENAMAMIRELAVFVPDFSPGERWGDPSSDIDWKWTRVDDNRHTKLFLNQTGSELFRPSATCNEVPNLFFAGDYCMTDINMATVEAAVVSGLNAAQGVVARQGVGAPVAVSTPETYPTWWFLALRHLWAPYAYGAKAWSMFEDATGIGPDMRRSLMSRPRRRSQR